MALPSKVVVAAAAAVVVIAAAFADAKDLVVQQPAEKTALTCEGTAAAAAAAAAVDAAAAAADVVAVDVKTKIDLNVEVPTSQLANFASSEFAVAPT